MDHLYQDCSHKQSAIPKATTSRPKSINETTTALIDLPKKKLVSEIRTSNTSNEQHTSTDPKTPLDKTTRDYCVLLAEANENQYYVEALVDSGSAINLMIENTYLKFFNKYNLSKETGNVSYGGVNKSPLVIYGYITPNIRLKLLSNHTFITRFAIVPNGTMTYDVLLGREFINQPGRTVILGKTLELKYDEIVMDRRERE